MLTLLRLLTLALLGLVRLPGANTTAQWFAGTYPGSRIRANVIVLHTTEGTSWPGYSDGASAPHVTVLPDLKQKLLIRRQHFSLDESSRALRNEAGGVETNTLNAVQIELIGTCDPAAHARWSRAKVPHIYWPRAPRWALKQLAMILRDISIACPGVPLTDAAVRGWLAYPASYANGNGQRLSGAEWSKAVGVLGHQHVPENCVHPDTMILQGDLTWVRAGDLVTGDRLVGFDEENTQVGSTAGRRFREAFATVHGTVEKDCYRVTMMDGTEVTSSADHKWLVNLLYVNRGSRIAWVETKDLDPAKHRIKSLGVDTWEERPDKEAGWLAGAIDCDGAVVFNKAGDSAILFGQSVGRTDVLNRFTAGLRDAKLDYYEMTRDKQAGFAGGEFTDVRVKGGLWRIVRFLAELGPEKFEAVRDNCWVNRVVGKTTTTEEIRSVEHVGFQPVVSLETSARTYVAAGLLCHNSHGDPGNIDIDRILEFAGVQVEPQRSRGPAVDKAEAALVAARRRAVRKGQNTREQALSGLLKRLRRTIPAKVAG